MRGEISARPSGLSNPAPIYVVGLFGMGYSDFYNFLVDGKEDRQRAAFAFAALARNAFDVMMRRGVFVIRSIHLGDDNVGEVEESWVVSFVDAELEDARRFW